MKLRLLWVFVVLASFVSFTHAQVDPTNLPKLTQYVTDFAGVLIPDQQASLESIAQSYDKQTSNQIAAVLIPHRNGNEIFDIGMNIFNTNAIWQAGKNNGLLLVISTQEKKIRIIVWYGLEWEIPDLLASNIIEDSVRPLVNKGDFAWAISAFYSRSINAISTWEGSQYKDSWSNDTDLFLIAIWLVIWIIFYFLVKPKNKQSWKKYTILGLLILLIILIIWLSILVLYGFIAALIFISGGGWSASRWIWFSWWFWWWGWGGGWFSGGGGSSGWGWAGD